MNEILQLKGRFDKRKNNAAFGRAKLPAKQSVKAAHLKELASQLTEVKKYWDGNTDIDGTIVSVHYTRVVAKCNRLRNLLSEGSKSPVESIRGVRFENEEHDGCIVKKHVFTHYVQVDAIEQSINKLLIVANMIENDFDGVITSEDIEKLGKEIPYSHKGIAKTNFANIILDAFYVERFDVDEVTEEIAENSLVTLYRTNIETKRLLEKFGINIFENKIIDGTTVLLNPDEMKLLINKAPYLIAMSVTDFSRITMEDLYAVDEKEDSGLIPKPTNEPIVGVIDTQFNERVYFNEWVEYHNMLPEEIELEQQDYIHGTAVTSIIVDGPKGNPDLDDGCGRFRVRHFGVSKQSGFSSFSVLKLIREIVASNPEIKVWNLSLGSKDQIKQNSISPEAAELDKIQTEYDVIFVVAGTNTPDGRSHENMMIGSPADSLNAIVVNSVSKKNVAASYKRVGPVLSFFHKPDLSYYGGDGTRQDEKIVVCENELGATYRAGTSFAAPWITRKLAYLIYVMGLSREVAKALLIDSSANWKSTGSVSNDIGYGIVPIKIRDILTTPDDEIKFILYGTAEDYETYTYNLPVPVVNDKHPFYAKATLTYFPQCDRNQGVDYTSTEMDLHFGRIISTGEKAKIKSIDNNKQTEEGQVVYEEEAREIYRKWDNVKRISESIKSRPVPRKSYDSGMWGLSIYMKERVNNKTRHPMQFGVIVTLKEIYGKNRIDDFTKMCMAHGWLVNRLNIENQIDIYQQAEEEIEFN